MNVVVEPSLPTIQEEASKLEPAKILCKRTRGGPSEDASTQPKPKVHKKRRTVRKMKVFEYVVQEDAKVESSTDLVTRMERNKKAAAEPEASLLDKDLAIASKIDVPAESLLKESIVEDAQKVVELAGGIQELVKDGDFLEVTEEVQKGKVACL